MADLTNILDYTLIGKYPTISKAASDKIASHIILGADDWGNSFSTDFIQETKKFYAGKQRQKCAYCRVKIHVDGYTEPVEHIVPRISKPNWMFVLHNLVVTCGGCNSSKGRKEMLSLGINSYGHEAIHCPTTSAAYFPFNPHYDKWSDHFEIEDGVFLKPKPNTKGPFTYTEFGMKRYTIILEYIFLKNIRDKKSSFRMLNARIRKEKDPEKIAALKEAYKSIENDES